MEETKLTVAGRRAGKTMVFLRDVQRQAFELKQQLQQERAHSDGLAEAISDLQEAVIYGHTKKTMLEITGPALMEHRAMREGGDGGAHQGSAGGAARGRDGSRD